MNQIVDFFIRIKNGWDKLNEIGTFRIIRHSVGMTLIASPAYAKETIPKSYLALMILVGMSLSFPIVFCDNRIKNE